MIGDQTEFSPDPVERLEPRRQITDTGQIIRFAPRTMRKVPKPIGFAPGHPWPAIDLIGGAVAFDEPLPTTEHLIRREWHVNGRRSDAKPSRIYADDHEHEDPQPAPHQEQNP